MSAVTLNERQRSKIRGFLSTCSGIYGGNESKTMRFSSAVRWMVRSGSPWELLPEPDGKWNSVYQRFARWCERGIWQQMHMHFANDPDLEWLLLDSTIIGAHPCAAGAATQPGGQQAQALGRSRGGFSTKIHAVVDALGNPLDFVLTPGQAHDVKQAPTLLHGRRCDYVIAAKADDADALSDLSETMGAIPVIPAGKNRIEPRIMRSICTRNDIFSSVSFLRSSGIVASFPASTSWRAAFSASCPLSQPLSGYGEMSNEPKHICQYS
jgi:transposase